MTSVLAPLTSDSLIAALGLPESARVHQRVPKKMLATNGAPTAADRKLIQEHIEEIAWLAAIKPDNAGVPAFEDETRSYPELAVLSVQLRGLDDAPQSKLARVAELLHRAIPYPLVLVLSDGARVHLSLVHIRWAQQEADKTVLDGEPLRISLPWSATTGTTGETAPAAPITAPAASFLQALPLHKQPKRHLYDLYQGWMDTLTAWEAATLTGVFAPSIGPEHAARRRHAIQHCRALDAEISQLKNKALKEKQIARQVEANLAIKVLAEERQRLVASL